MTSIGKWMPLETIMLNKINQTINTTISLICVVYIHKFRMHVCIHMCVFIGHKTIKGMMREEEKIFEEVEDTVMEYVSHKARKER